MKKLFSTLLVFLLIFPMYLKADEVKDISPYFSFATFYSPIDGPYVETYLTILGHSVYFAQNPNNKYQASLELTIVISKEENVVDFTKINLKSPEVEDTLDINFSLIDVQRFLLKNGNYNIELIIKDLNSPFKEFVIEESLSIDFKENQINLSGIQLIEKIETTQEQNMLTKSGLDLYPLPLNFFPAGINSVRFYSEIYNTEKSLGADESFLLLTKIEQLETRKVVFELQRAKREKARSVVNFIQEFDISMLPSGNYMLVVEVRDKNNILVAENALFFQRSKPSADVLDFNTFAYQNSFVASITSIDTIVSFIKILRPIASPIERTYIDNNLHLKELAELQQFLYSFWATRDAIDPYQKFVNYNIEVAKVEATFGTKIKRGYETDRGRVYLQYGPPNSRIVSESEPNSYPYEIWHFYSLNNQRNRRFVFFNRSFATNDWELLHSDAFGEIQNHNWQIALQQRNFLEMQGGTDNPQSNSRDWGWGSKAEDYWNNPR